MPKSPAGSIELGAPCRKISSTAPSLEIQVKKLCPIDRTSRSMSESSANCSQLGVPSQKALPDRSNFALNVGKFRQQLPAWSSKSKSSARSIELRAQCRKVSSAAPSLELQIKKLCLTNRTWGSK